MMNATSFPFGFRLARAWRTPLSLIEYKQLDSLAEFRVKSGLRLGSWTYETCSEAEVSIISSDSCFQG
jgi:hypothetical protein